MKQITSRYKLYIRGEFVREVEYQFPAEVAPADAFAGLRARDAEDRRQRETDIEAFEAFADAAAEFGV